MNTQKKTIKDTLSIFSSSKGFTLLELLVVVLIIGILAAIALPQYQMAVGKAKFSTLKNITKSLQQSAQRYYLANNEYPYTPDDFDIDLSVENYNHGSGYGIIMKLHNDTECTLWYISTNYVSCNKKIFGKKVNYYVNRETGKPLFCIVSGTPNPTGSASRLCAKETNKPILSTCGETCQYRY